MSQDFEIGVISDTHGLLRPEAIDQLRDVDAIVHAGDIGGEDIIPRLGEIAPVHAIKGNIDQEHWANVYPDELNINLAGYEFYVIHNIKQIQETVYDRRPNMIICGHSHKPRVDTVEGVTVLNPGSAGPRRFRLPICLAKITIDQTSLTPRIIDLIE